jgi:hypothetical protein
MHHNNILELLSQAIFFNIPGTNPSEKCQPAVVVRCKIREMFVIVSRTKDYCLPVERKRDERASVG